MENGKSIIDMLLVPTPLIREIFFNRIYEFRSTKPNPRIFDCGANIGMATFFFKSLYPEASIEAFEADPELACILKRNISENYLANVQVNDCALGNKNGVGEFYPNNNPVLGKMGKPSVGSKPSIPISIRRLSEWIGEGVDFLKLDVEGAEWEIVKDLYESNVLWKIKEAVVEYHGNTDGEESRFGEFLSF
ncbi:hypothetical protein A946_03905 [Methylacidiphilum kamchatkense Kam1]|uniref:FkbM family methyltransferase n=1 Tax=Methylacidiphilum kamchatkense Kam1 TaxID=1202785 RepID=A0A0C1RM80_9BACT|nr:FkbM family methyltransferase [Methylacidiphilum kamchatkense]KIE59157.1 hypothetical protein A946_03905 [Methylacidiphilum kamchatkense Kam1]QDQ42916.1 FkbM family methyltransferase [Methylacidiphilum kamchatkense Kam1]